jgi:hypothetical protein
MRQSIVADTNLILDVAKGTCFTVQTQLNVESAHTVPSTPLVSLVNSFLIQLDPGGLQQNAALTYLVGAKFIIRASLIPEQIEKEAN